MITGVPTTVASWRGRSLVVTELSKQEQRLIECAGLMDAFFLFLEICFHRHVLVGPFRDVMMNL